MQLPKSAEQMQAGIDALNLEAIKFKLLDPSEGKGWSREYVEQLEIAYKRFLLLSVKYLEIPTVPMPDVDVFWHYHILDTMKYAEDCQNAFGFFLHHFPYLGLRGEEDIANHQQASALTHELYEKEFGEPMNIMGYENAASCTKCTKIMVENAASCTKCTKVLIDDALMFQRIVKPDVRPTFA
ncbi:MAG: hypothetical protein RIT27_363 [Pseudomonadota bacterium]|jgi:hypothetical protein